MATLHNTVASRDCDQPKDSRNSRMTAPSMTAWARDPLPSPTGMGTYLS
ncbi:MAG TPA: hypothetical protein VK887_16350 [Pseudonocardiaceae bacterium]|nr:hypothetical protein [Pseudonocardiaceae bacterium]